MTISDIIKYKYDVIEVCFKIIHMTILVYKAISGYVQNLKKKACKF